MAYVPAEAFGRPAVAVPNNAWIYSVASNSKSTAVAFAPGIPVFIGSIVPAPVLVQIVGGGGAYLIGYPSG